jgi:ABC-2 type transport system ATP-binding protein
VTTDTPANIKTMATSSVQKVLVEFAETVDNKALLTIQGVIDIQPISDKTWLILGGETDLRPQIFKFAVDNKLTLLTLNKQESTLENVFLDLVR